MCGKVCILYRILIIYTQHLAYTLHTNIRYVYSILELWKANLRQVNEKAAEALADPAKYPNLFPDLNYGLMVRRYTGVYMSVC